jgi:MerR family mercuric resistance operon transcriptional regulator
MMQQEMAITSDKSGGNVGEKDTALSIGGLSHETGCNIETIRYYEKIDLLPPPPRTPGGHRQYGHDHLDRLIFIRRSRELGFSLNEVRTLLGLVDGGDYTCEEVRNITLHHLEDVRAKIASLRKLQKTLEEISTHCLGGEVPDCPIIQALSNKTKF